MSCAGIIVLELCLEIWVRIGATIVFWSFSHICGDLYQDIVGDAFFVLGMNKHAEKDWVSDLLMP